MGHYMHSWLSPSIHKDFHVFSFKLKPSLFKKVFVVVVAFPWRIS